MAESVPKEKERVKIKNYKYYVLKSFEEHFAFYRNAEKREGAMFKNLMRFMKRDARSKMPAYRPGRQDPSRTQKPLPGSGILDPGSLPNAILIAGGFHTQGLTEKFKQAGISYLLVTPKIESIPDEIPYRAHMRGEVSWKDYFEVENGKVNLYKAFVRAARDRLLAVDARRWTVDGKSERLSFHRPPSTVDRLLLKRWRDQILLDLARKNRIEKAGKYTKFLDEVSHDARPAMHGDLRSQWMANVERFIRGLRGLQSNNQLTQKNILNLLKPSTIPEKFVNPEVLVENGSVPISSGRLASDLESSVRSEARIDAEKVIAIGNSPKEAMPFIPNAEERINEVKRYLSTIGSIVSLDDIYKKFGNTPILLIAEALSQEGFYNVGGRWVAKKTGKTKVLVLGEVHERSRYQEMISQIQTGAFTHVGLELPGSQQPQIDRYLKGELDEGFLKSQVGNEHAAIIKVAKEQGIQVVALEATDKQLKEWLDADLTLRKMGDPLVITVLLSPKRDEYAAQKIFDILNQNDSVSFVVLRGSLHLEGILTALNRMKRSEVRSQDTASYEEGRKIAKVKLQEQFRKMLRLEARTSKTLTEIANNFLLMLAPPEARAELRIKAINSNELVDEFIQIQADTDVFAEVLRSQTDKRIREVEQSMSGLVELDTVRDRRHYWMGLLDPFKGKKLSVLIRLSGREGPGRLRNKADALIQAKEQLERALVSIREGKDQGLSAILHENKITATIIRNPGSLRPTAFTEQSVLPAIRSDDGPFENFKNDFLFQIKPADTDLRTDDSVLTQLRQL